MFQKILIANRGEIAVRIIRACREMGIKTVAVYSKAEKEAAAYPAGRRGRVYRTICTQRSASYLNMERILSAAVTCGASRCHPSGISDFLSENSKFARYVRENAGLRTLSVRLAEAIGRHGKQITRPELPW